MTDLQKQQITQMRMQGKKYVEISDSLGIAPENYPKQQIFLTR